MGGVLVDLASWRLIFAVNVLPVALTLFLMAGMRERVPLRKSALDVPGAMLAIAWLSGPVYALTEQERLGWSHPAVVVPLVAGFLHSGSLSSAKPAPARP